MAAPAKRLAELVGHDRARDLRKAWRAAKPVAMLRRAADLGQRVLTPVDEGWPGEGLAALDDPPCALFVQGAPPPRGPAPAVGVVGTRDATPYALEVAHALGSDLARAGLPVVSGFAVGVDGAAHRGALEGGGGTWAVLGCGIDYPYPVAHLDLRDELLAAGGGFVSEFAPGMHPRKQHFPRRNRIVAALVEALVVVEAPARSGALITARFALDLGREILSVPGNVGQRGRAGCHRLLREGAALCESAADVLATLGLDPAAGASLGLRAEPEGEAGVLWRALDAAAPSDAGVLCTRTGLGPERVASVLVELEMAGRIRRASGGGFLRSI